MAVVEKIILQAMEVIIHPYYGGILTDASFICFMDELDLPNQS